MGTIRNPGTPTGVRNEILSDLARNIKPDLSAGRTLKEAIPYFSLKTAGSQEAYTFERLSGV